MVQPSPAMRFSAGRHQARGAARPRPRWGIGHARPLSVGELWVADRQLTQAKSSGVVPTRNPQPVTEGQGEDERDNEPECCQSEKVAPELFEVHLEAGQEQQEPQPDEREDLDG